ncbi:hypothetical protein [Spartinivicinus ruber]|uniref:hypothetical protein n=1 Tax=Spartinivicinus ruber TaxID=2683272 RepID=UPI0013D48D9F|nr:hypothetical protein [Spartinivicinus ruber]
MKTVCIKKIPHIAETLGVLQIGITLVTCYPLSWQDHRRIKRLTRPILGFMNYHAAQKTLASI